MTLDCCRIDWALNLPVERFGSGGVYADSGCVIADLHSRLYQMMPILGEMFATDAGMRRSIIGVLRSILASDSHCERTWGDSIALTTISIGCMS